jgi:hypothetical protein
MVALARAIDGAGITRHAAGKMVDWDPGHLGKVLLGRAPGRVAMRKALAFVPDLNLWEQLADREERAEMKRLMASIDERARKKVSS